MKLLGLYLLFLSFLVVLCGDGEQSPFTFDDIYNPLYQPKIFRPYWQKGTETFLFQNSQGDVVRYNATYDIHTILIPASTLAEFKAEQYFVSPDQKFVLFAYKVRQRWRHSFTASYLIMNLENKELHMFPNGPLQNETLAYAMWSSVGHSLTFVYKNNLYVQEGPTSAPRQLTTDGNTTVCNAVPNWLYEEEILESRTSHQWPPDNQFIVYAKIDDSEVRRHHWVYYGRDGDVYGQLKSVAYPKAGYVVNGKLGPNSRVKLYVVDVRRGSTIQLLPPEPLRDKDHYYLDATWRDENHILVTWSNRVQNKSISVLYNAGNSREVTEIITTSENNGWIEVPHPSPWFIDNGERYVTILPNSVSRGRARQLALVTCKVGMRGRLSFLTEDAEVQEIVAVDQQTRYVYYITSYHSRGRQIWRIRITTLRRLHKRHVVECLSCSEDIQYVGASFSSSAENYILEILGPDVPQFFLRSTAKGKEYKSITMESNEELKNRLRSKLLPTKEFFRFNNGDGSEGNGQVLIPPDPRKNETFPMLVFTYAGPNTQAVNTKFPFQRIIDSWLVHMASENRVLIVSTDGRGSMANGDDLKFAIYKKLSTVEIEDQILGAKFFKKESGFKIANNAAIFGWSYGGFATAHALAFDPDTFMCGVSVAPTTNKGIYDTAYSERYLGLITDAGGAEAYNRTNLVKKADLFRRKKYFIAHGLADDNVHFTHFAHFVRELQKRQIMFRQNTYPDENHAIGTIDINKHLFLSIENFLFHDCWPQPPPTKSEFELARQFFGSVQSFFEGILDND